MEAFQFTFNDPAGACPTCAGIGTAMRVHPKLLVPDPAAGTNSKPVNVTVVALPPTVTAKPLSKIEPRTTT